MSIQVNDNKTMNGEHTESQKTKKNTPVVSSKLRSRMISVPESISEATGIIILGRRIKSLIFTTDVAIIKNNNAQSVIAVYPFTPQLAINHAILEAASVPVFVGVGGGLTNGARSAQIALQAELMGAYGVVVNSPTDLETIAEIKKVVDVPIISTVVDENNNYMEKIEAGVSILNVSGAKRTAEIVKSIREKVGPEFPIIATGGPTDDTIRAAIKAGANAITYTPPRAADIFSEIMDKYRHNN